MGFACASMNDDWSADSSPVIQALVGQAAWGRHQRRSR